MKQIWYFTLSSVFTAVFVFVEVLSVAAMWRTKSTLNQDSQTAEDSQTEAQFSHVQVRSAVKPEQTDAQVNIVVLAGGFNAELVLEILKKLNEDTLGKDSSSSMLRKTVVRPLLPQHIVAMCSAYVDWRWMLPYIQHHSCESHTKIRACYTCSQE